MSNINDKAYHKDRNSRKLLSVLKAIDDMPLPTGDGNRRPCPVSNGEKIACRFVSGTKDACIVCWTHWLEANVN